MKGGIINKVHKLGCRSCQNSFKLSMGGRDEEQGALEKVVPLIGRLVPPLRAALNHPDKGVLRAGLKAIRYSYMNHGLISFSFPFFCEIDV